VHEICFVPHLIHSGNVWWNHTHDSNYVTFPTLPPPYIYSFVYASAPKNQWLPVMMQSFPYYVTLRIISFHVTNCAKIRKISCACTTELFICGQRFPVALRISKEGSALMIEDFKRIRRRCAKSFQRLITMFRRNVMSTVPGLFVTLLQYLTDIRFLVWLCTVLYTTFPNDTGAYQWLHASTAK